METRLTKFLVALLIIRAYEFLDIDHTYTDQKNHKVPTWTIGELKAFI